MCLVCSGVGAKKFGIYTKPRETNLSGGTSREICQDVPKAPEKLEKKMCVQFWAPTWLTFEKSGLHM